ncbi:MAG: hypothetical protein AAGG38_00245 [Planctomycetota bacterium]
MNTHKPSGRGFALLIVMIVLAVLASVLTAAVRSTSRDRIAVTRQVETLQTKWARLSAGQTLAPLAPAMLDPTPYRPAEDRDAALPPRLPAEARLRLPLRTVRLDLVAMDEQAKLNLNTLDPQAMRNPRSLGGLASLVPTGSPARAALRLLPFPEALAGPPTPASPRDARVATGTTESGPDDADTGPKPENAGPQDTAEPRDPGDVQDLPEPPAALFRRYGSYGQVFARTDARSLVGSEPGRGWVSSLTVYGDGRLNLRSVSPKVVYAAALPRFGEEEARRLAARVRRGDVSSPRPRDQSRVRPERQEGGESSDDRPPESIATLFTERSACHTLWVLASPRPGGGIAGGSGTRVFAAGLEQTSMWLVDGPGPLRSVAQW